MAAGQLWLFPPPKPLVERLGDDFSRAFPAGPGVYLTCGATEGVLSVGKARNLCKRLASYRVANPERFPRRIIRLLHRRRSCTSPRGIAHLRAQPAIQWGWQKCGRGKRVNPGEQPLHPYRRRLEASF